MKRAWLAGGAAAVLAAGAAAFWPRYAAGPPAPSQAEIARLTEERRRLREEVRVLLTQQDLMDFGGAPPGNVLVGVPNVVSERLISQVLTGLLSEVRLRLTNIRAHAEDEVKARVLFKNRTLGRYTLDVDIKEVRAVLKPGAPALQFGGDRIALQLPVELAAGRGDASVHFKWDGQGLAGAVCGDVDVSPDVSSRVKPATYRLKGAFRLAAQGETVVAAPDFGPVVLDIRLDPGPDTWKVLAETVADVKDDKNGICRMAIQKLDVKSLVKGIIDNGFKVKLPRTLFKPVSLPAAVEQSVEFQGKVVSLNARPIGLRVTPKVLWYGVEFGTEVQGRAAPR
jgi:hypothetical protein